VGLVPSLPSNKAARRAKIAQIKRRQAITKAQDLRDRRKVM
jgi:hypothetical protein